MKRRVFLLLTAATLVARPALAQQQWATPSQLFHWARERISHGSTWSANVVIQVANWISANAKSISRDEIVEAFGLVTRLSNEIDGKSGESWDRARQALKDARSALAEAFGGTEADLAKALDEAIAKSKELEEMMRPSPTVGDPPK